MKKIITILTVVLLCCSSVCAEETKETTIDFSAPDFDIKKLPEAEFWRYSEWKAKQIEQNCVTTAENLPDYDDSTLGIAIMNKRSNDCVTEAITKEIKEGFSPKKQAEMLEKLQQLKTTVFSFYNIIYSENKYCDGQCGTMAVIYPYIDEAIVLQKFLKNLIYLNINQNGY